MKFTQKLMLAVAVVATAAGCIKENGGSNYDPLESVRPGVSIYNAAIAQNEMAMVPADIALRLAFLLAEAEKQGKINDLDEVFVQNAGNVKTLLFGLTTKITRQSNGDYLVGYAGGGGLPPYDAFARIGTVRIATGGSLLAQTDEQHPWRVSLDTEQLTVGGRPRVTILSTGQTALWRKDDTGYAIAFRDIKAYIEKQSTSAWSGNFLLTPSKADDLSFSALVEASFGFSGAADGTSFRSFDNRTPAQMSYRVEEGVYRPSTGSSRQIVGGREQAELTDSADYSAELYPSPEVAVKWTFVKNELTYAITYNGRTVEISQTY